MVLSGLNGKQAAGNSQTFLTERLKTMLDRLLIDTFLFDKSEFYSMCCGYKPQTSRPPLLLLLPVVICVKVEYMCPVKLAPNSLQGPSLKAKGHRYMEIRTIQLLHYE